MSAAQRLEIDDRCAQCKIHSHIARRGQAEGGVAYQMRQTRRDECLADSFRRRRKVDSGDAQGRACSKLGVKREDELKWA